MSFNKKPPQRSFLWCTYTPSYCCSVAAKGRFHVSTYGVYMCICLYRLQRVLFKIYLFRKTILANVCSRWTKENKFISADTDKGMEIALKII